MTDIRHSCLMGRTSNMLIANLNALSSPMGMRSFTEFSNLRLCVYTPYAHENKVQSVINCSDIHVSNNIYLFWYLNCMFPYFLYDSVCSAVAF